MAKIIKLIDLLKESPPEQDKEKSQQAPPAGGENSKELKIDIPNSPFEPDINQVKDQLKNILKQWQVKQYPSDEYRWKDYYRDILKL